MSTKREKQLAMMILKERIEHATGKKVIFEDYKKNPETQILENEDYSEFKITLDIPEYVIMFCKEKNIIDIAGFYKSYVEYQLGFQSHTGGNDEFEIWAGESDNTVEFIEESVDEIENTENPEQLEEALFGLLPNDFQKAKELIVQILKNPKIEQTMKPEFKTIWEQAKPLFLKWHDNTGKEKQRTKEQQQEFQNDIKKIGEVMKPLAEAFGKTKKPVMGGGTGH